MNKNDIEFCAKMAAMVSGAGGYGPRVEFVEASDSGATFTVGERSISIDISDMVYVEASNCMIRILNNAVGNSTIQEQLDGLLNGIERRGDDKMKKLAKILARG